MPTCPNCSQAVAEGANFCPSCGASLGSPAIESMIADARRALSANPDDASARHNLALAYKLGGMDDLAIQEFQRVAELQPDFADVHYELGFLHAKHGRTDQAIAALRRATSLDPDHRRARALLERLRAGR